MQAFVASRSTSASLGPSQMLKLRLASHVRCGSHRLRVSQWVQQGPDIWRVKGTDHGTWCG